MTPSVRAAGGREGQQEQHHCHHQQQRSSAAASPPPSARRRHRPRAAASPCAAAAASAAAALLRSALAPADKTSHISMSRFCRAYKICMTPWHDRPAFEPALLCRRFESRWSCPRGATRIARVCACDKTRREEKEKRTSMFLLPRPRRDLPFVLAPMQRRLSPREMAPPRRRRRDQPRSSSERCRAATDMTVGDGVSRIGTCKRDLSIA